MDFEKITELVIELEVDDIANAINEALDEEKDPFEILNALTKGMDEVGRRYEEKEKSVVMQRAADDNWNWPIRQPIWRALSYQVLENSRRSARKPIFKKHKPGLSQGPGRHDIGDQRQLIDELPAWHIGADHQPGQRPANQQRKQGSPNCYGERMLQRGIHINSTENTCQHPDIVINSEFAYHGIWDAGEIMRLPGHRGLNHAIQRYDDHVVHQKQHDQRQNYIWGRQPAKKPSGTG